MDRSACFVDPCLLRCSYRVHRILFCSRRQNCFFSSMKRFFLLDGDQKIQYVLWIDHRLCMIFLLFSMRRFWILWIGYGVRLCILRLVGANGMYLFFPSYACSNIIFHTPESGLLHALTAGVQQTCYLYRVGPIFLSINRRYFLLQCEKKGVHFFMYSSAYCE